MGAAAGGKLLWISPALPGRTHDLTAARAHRIIRICERQGVPVLADRAYIGAGYWVTTPIRRLPHQDLNPTQRTIRPSPVSSASASRTKRREAEVLADLPPGPLQPQPPVVHLRRRPHPEASTLKDLTDPQIPGDDRTRLTPGEPLGRLGINPPPCGYRMPR
ncbi:hypothetical protein GCM10010206_12270 [Streptomyces cinerochromogenes]|nr:hypothetical protein GCM10010206_12270 [Streptomyces cinerochromogenes]